MVLQGSALPSLVGTAPSRVVAFAYDGSDWTQVPVQVDEKDMVNPATILNRATPASLPNGGGEYKIPVYTQPPTAAPGYTWTDVYTPTDSNPTLDGNDEVSFLVNDSGKQAPAGANPSGVTTSTRKQVTLTDPDDGTKAGYVYLYASTTLTGGGAGTTGVQYTFSLDSGAYKATYGMGTSSRTPNNKRGPNPEHSTIVTPTYTQSYNDRWANDGLTIKSGSSSRVDLLDRSPYIVPNLACGRTEDTYDDVVMSSPYSGAFVANISGPVRAIRSHMGANSFTYIVTTDVFYPQREDTVIELRGHAGLPAFATYDDITTNLAGMRYDDPANVGLSIDGVADPFTPSREERGPVLDARRLVDGVGSRRLARHHPGARDRHRRRAGHLVLPRRGGHEDLHRGRIELGRQRREPHASGRGVPQHRPDARGGEHVHVDPLALLQGSRSGPLVGRQARGPGPGPAPRLGVLTPARRSAPGTMAT